MELCFQALTHKHIHFFVYQKHFRDKNFHEQEGTVGPKPNSTVHWPFLCSLTKSTKCKPTAGQDSENSLWGYERHSESICYLISIHSTAKRKKMLNRTYYFDNQFNIGFVLVSFKTRRSCLVSFIFLSTFFHHKKVP